MALEYAGHSNPSFILSSRRMSTAYHVDLEVFEGPLDLLLQLVSKQKLDVTEVSISTITKKYLDTVRRMGEMKLDVASGFLVLAATLLELKSLKLLPSRGYDPEVAALLEERDLLLHRLIEYSTFREAAAAMNNLFAGSEGHHFRTPEIPPELSNTLPDLVEGVTPNHLLDLATDILKPRPHLEVDTSFMPPVQVSVGEMVTELEVQLKAHGATTFRQLCSSAGGRMGVIVRFLALLELFRSQMVDMEQEAPFEQITVRYREPKTGSSSAAYRGETETRGDLNE